MIVKVTGIVICIIDFKLQELPLFKFVLQNELFLPLWVKGVVNSLCSVQADPTLCLAVLDVQDTKGVRLGKEIHVGEVLAPDGELHCGDGDHGLTRGEVILTWWLPSRGTLHLGRSHSDLQDNLLNSGLVGISSFESKGR